ncbi:putative diacylglycerol O-acyltransferase tgs1 [Neophaeococcomyces mojaviensis]|uniref:Diacylglycerol O-acyltransferase tgs1 n=1 Tax=Neophaeococcomyces mojaviensis TaxID=3383035 RepID=A0ACC3A1M2_9EURO|nr:putative diacylglycerol O-acyltransferase tgs1 [Knufia sp. JES_112]
MFSLYDEGIWTTDDSWFEVTHESIARTIADHVAAARPSNKPIMLDCFAGVGGNAIAFALSGAFRRVYAIEKNEAALACARHNASIYGVLDKITFFHGDCFDILGLNGVKPGVTVDVLSKVISQAGIIFASPPWGGPGYKNAGDVFDLDLMPYSLEYMYSRFAQITKSIVLFLPRTSDLNQIAKYVEGNSKAQIVHYCTHEKSKALCVYFGEWQDVTGR